MRSCLSPSSAELAAFRRVWEEKVTAALAGGVQFGRRLIEVDASVPNEPPARMNALLRTLPFNPAAINELVLPRSADPFAIVCHRTASVQS